MTRSAIWMALAALLLALLWLASPAAAQAAECDDGLDNDGDGYCDTNMPGTVCTDGSTPGDPGCRNRQPSSFEDPECNDKDEFGLPLDNDDDDLVANILDPQCYYGGEFLPWWNNESRKRPEPAPINGGCDDPPPDPLPEDWVGCSEDDIAGCGAVEGGDAPLLALPFLWFWFRRRGSRKA